MLEFVAIGIDSGEAPACARCASETRGAKQAGEPRSLEAILTDVANVVDRWGSGPGPNILFEGGDPPAHPELADIVKRSRRPGARLGLALGSRGVGAGISVHDLLELGIRHYHVTVLGDADTHDSLVGVAGAFDAQMRFIDDVRATAERPQRRRACIVGRVAVCVHTLKTATWAVGELVGAGVDWVVLDLDNGLDPRTSAAWIASAVESGTSNGRWVSVEGRDPAEFGLSPIASRSAVTVRRIAQ